MTSGSLKLRVDHYALLRNMLLKVKGVPALYLPLMYYPLSKDNRNTGFLMPSYGSSSYKGQTISNAFFWAINRSQDATILHDWYSKTGQSIAGEYRYVSLGGLRKPAHGLPQRAPHHVYVTSTAMRSISRGAGASAMYGNLSQSLVGRGTRRGEPTTRRDLTVDQLYDTDISRASQADAIVRRLGERDDQRASASPGRTIGTSISPKTRLRRSRGNSPRINIARPDRLIRRLPIYASVNSEYVRIESEAVQQRPACCERNDDVSTGSTSCRPSAFRSTSWRFCTFNTTAQFRNTFWTDSLLVNIVDGVERRPARVWTHRSRRRFVELSADVNGPTLVRIWDAPNSTYAQRFRHSIEPFAQVLYRTAIDNYNAIPKLESTDSIVGNATSYNYGMNTRFYAKRTVDGPRAIPREVINASIQQTYNTNALLDSSRRADSGRATSSRLRTSHPCRCSCARRRSMA